MSKTLRPESFSRRDAMRRLGFAGLGIGLSTGAAFAERATTGPATSHQGGGFYRVKLGDVEVTLVSDGGFMMNPRELLPNADRAELDEVAKQSFVKPDGVPGHVNTLLVRKGAATILIDTGSGANFGPTAGQMPANLARAGVKPADVTHVLLTHAHPDHFGGLLDERGAPRFPNAEIVMNEAEHAFWTSGNTVITKAYLPEAFQRSVGEDAVKTMDAVKKQLMLKKPDDTIGGVVTLVAAPGHTPGHVAARIDGGNESLLYWTDAVHLPPLQFTRPEWHCFYDAEPDVAVKTRERLLDMVATDRLLVSGAHIAFPAMGHVSRHASGFVWLPRVWEW